MMHAIRLGLAIAVYAAVAYALYRTLKWGFTRDRHFVNGIDVRELSGRDKTAILMGYRYLPDYGAEVSQETADKIFEWLV